VPILSKYSSSRAATAASEVLGATRRLSHEAGLMERVYDSSVSLPQLSPPPGLRVIVASFVLSPSGKGLSVFDLWERVDSVLPIVLRRRLESQMAAALGSEWRNGTRLAFDPRDAVNSLRFYHARDIPRVDPAVPIGVSEVRFVSDLTGARAISAKSLSSEGDLFESIASDL
jgi:hypothetical protein